MLLDVLATTGIAKAAMMPITAITTMISMSE